MKEVAVGFQSFRLWSNKPRPERLEVRSAEFAHDVELCRHGTIAYLINPGDGFISNCIGEKRAPAIDGESNFNSLRLEVEVSDQPTQRCSHVRRVPRKKPHYSKLVKAILLTNQQAEMWTPRHRRATLNQPATLSERYPIVRIVKEGGLKAQVVDDLRWILSKVTQYIGHAMDRSDAQHRWGS